jgi:hypothetical protein
MTSELMIDVSEYLSDLDIDHDISETTLLLNADSIVNRVPHKTTREAYNKLTAILNARFESRFNLVAITNDQLQLDRVGTAD